LNIQDTEKLSAGLPDIAAEAPPYPIPIVRAGIQGLELPIELLVRGKSDERVVTTALVDVGVGVPVDQRGTHMSMLVLAVKQALTQKGHLAPRVSDVARKVWDVLKDPGTVTVQVACVYFIAEYPSPASHLTFPKGYLVRVAVTLGPVEGELRNPNWGKPQFYHTQIAVEVPYISTCPCSASLVEQEARGGYPHMQRGKVDLTVTIDPDYQETVWFEDLIDLVEAELVVVPFPIVKRIDEAWLAQASAKHTAFVEDVARVVAQSCTGDSRFASWHVVAESQESIHQHNAYAVVEGYRDEA